MSKLGISSLNNFYKGLKVNFNNITEEKINELKEKAETLNYFFNNKDTDLNRTDKYIKISELIHTNYSPTRKTNSPYSTQTTAEKVLLLMFSVDPDFKAIFIHLTENKISEIKEKVTEILGLYDPNLVKIQNYYIKHFFSEKNKKEFDEKVEKSVYR